MIYKGCPISLSNPLPSDKIKNTPIIAHFKGHFNTNYWAKFQIDAMFFSILNLTVSELCFEGKCLNIIKLSGMQE